MKFILILISCLNYKASCIPKHYLIETEVKEANKDTASSDYIRLAGNEHPHKEEMDKATTTKMDGPTTTLSRHQMRAGADYEHPHKEEMDKATTTKMDGPTTTLSRHQMRAGADYEHPNKE